MMTRVTLKEIAQKANVSIGTVDRALNGRERINPETKERVLEIARELNYCPNTAAKVMSKNTNYRIGILMGEKPTELCTHMKNGIQDALDEYFGFGIVGEFFVSRTLSPALQMKAIEQIDADRFDAFLVNAGSNDITPWIDSMVNAGKYVATFNTDANESKRSFYVGEDPLRAGFLIGGFMSLFLRKARPRIAILTGFSSNSSHANRCTGVIQSITEKHRDAEFVYGAYEDEPILVRQIIENLLTDSKPLDAIFFASGIGADIGCEAVAKLPEEIRPKVFGYDVFQNIVPFMESDICMACISQDPYWQGYYAAQMLSRFGAFGDRPSRDTFHIHAKLITKHNVREHLLDRHQSDSFLL